MSHICEVDKVTQIAGNCSYVDYIPEPTYFGQITSGCRLRNAGKVCHPLKLQCHWRALNPAVHTPVAEDPVPTTVSATDLTTCLRLCPRSPSGNVTLPLILPGIWSSPQNIVWQYIVMQLSYHFQNIVKISISLKFWKYHTILVKGYALWNSHFRSTLKAIHSGSCLQCASKIKITWLFAFVKTYLQHELAYFCHF